MLSMYTFTACSLFGALLQSLQVLQTPNVYSAPPQIVWHLLSALQVGLSKQAPWPVPGSTCIGCLRLHVRPDPAGKKPINKVLHLIGRVASLLINCKCPVEILIIALWQTIAMRRGPSVHHIQFQSNPHAHPLSSGVPQRRSNDQQAVRHGTMQWDMRRGGRKTPPAQPIGGRSWGGHGHPVVRSI